MVNGIWETRIDASFGELIEKAVRELQEKDGIAVDGSAGPETFETSGTHDSAVLLRIVRAFMI